ncbi:ATP-binding protein [Rhodohalobacter barkolensis]|uniref:ATP-binding protein n=1 Tax=Rhodohalobacter barkolensis TaxID=2053187 RepID=A0A2N0VHS5_9BACT|nr:ATP-binding protein [Rhodohalobacter barkolensis]PKD43743.1 ATP-binding protein [Rhodohalobacter barkolensis]
MKKIEFLKQSVNQIRKSIRDIDDSYNHEWDIIAELCQNSIDAIKEANPSSPEIFIRIDALNKTIVIRDNGIGIDSDKLPKLLAPFSTNKDLNEELIGEKGVGLTFVIFSCNNFRIKTTYDGVTSVGSIIDAFNWKSRTDEELLKLEFDQIDEDFTGTEIILRQVKSSPIFDLNFAQLQYVLRTKTALGNTKTLWNDGESLSINLEHVDINGIENSTKLPYKYWAPTDGLDKNTKISLEEYKEYANQAHRDDNDKRRKLRDKIIYDIGRFDHKGRVINYYACLVPKRSVWNFLSIHNHLALEENFEDDEWMEKFYYSVFQNGIYTSVKGMPTGVSVDHPITGAQGSWAQIFIIFEDRQLTFDIGRKSIHGAQARIYRKYSKSIFSEFRKLAKYISGDIIVETDWDKEETFADIEDMLDLNSENTRFQKTPRHQEASVAAIFYELIGREIITEITPLVSGYRNKYDLYAKWGKKKVVIEFKSKLRNVLKDFSDEQKMFNEIDVIVCYDVNEEDIQAMKNRNLDVEKINKSVLGGNKIFPNSTHQIILSGLIPPIFVIDIKSML